MMTVRGLALAKEFGEDAIYAKLMAYAEENYDLGRCLRRVHIRAERTPSQGPVQRAPDGRRGRLIWGNGAHLRRPQPEEVPGARDGLWSGLPQCLPFAYYDVDRRCLGLHGLGSGPRSANLVPGQQREAQRLDHGHGQPLDDWRIVGDEPESRSSVNTRSSSASSGRDIPSPHPLH